MINAFASGGRLWEAKLASRAVLSISGADTISFLQGLVTKDVTSLSDVNAAPLHAAMLNSKGRLMCDLLLHRSSASSNSTQILSDVPAPSSGQLKNVLTKFKLRADVSIEDASTDLSIVARWSIGPPSISDVNLPDPPDLPPDPRHTQLGARGPVPLVEMQEGLPPYSGAMLGVQAATKGDYTALRYSLGVAEGPTEIPFGSAIPLEYNIDLLQGVTFDKGCYMGQELVARTHYQGLIRKRVVPVHLDPACSNADEQAALVGAEVFAEGRKRALGTMRGAMNQLGIAHVRLDNTWEAVKAKQQLYVEVNGKRTGVTPKAPDWWPRELRPSTFSNLLWHL